MVFAENEGLPDEFSDALMVAVVFVATGVVVTVTDADVAFVGTVIETGTDASALLLNRYTTVPAGAGPFRLTLPVAVLPPTIDPVRLMPEIDGARTVATTDAEALLRVAVRTTGVFALTGMVVTVKVAVVFPAGTVTVAGIDAFVPVLEMSTTYPPARAA